MFHEIHKDLYGKPFKRDWVVKVVFLIQTLPTFGAVAITTLRYTAEHFTGYLIIIFNMLFQLVLTKFFKSELFSCLPKVDHMIT